MKKKLIIAFTCLVILINVYGLVIGLLSNKKGITPIAVNGILDVSMWDFKVDGVIPLDGEWEFYKGRILYPNDFKKFPAISPKIIKVPSGWNHFGSATYRLKINIRDGNPIYGIKTTNIQMSNRIIVNGKTIGESGIPKKDKSYTAKNTPYVCYIKLKPGINEIIVQVANYHYSAGGGIKQSIFLGKYEAIMKLREKAIIQEWIMVTGFFIMGLYFIGLYPQRKADLSILFFGLFSIVLSLYIASHGEKVIYMLFPSISYSTFTRIQFSTAPLNLTLLNIYIYLSFKQFYYKRFMKISVAMGLLATVFELFFHTVSNPLLYAQLIIGTMICLYMIYVLVTAIFHKVEGSVYIFFAILSIMEYSAYQGVQQFWKTPETALPPLEPFVFLLMFALQMSLRLSNTYKKINELSVQLIKSDKLKDDFLTRVSHEFKTPLHGIMNISQSMMETSATKLHPDHKERLELLTSISSRLSQLVYDILDFSKLKQGMLSTHPTAVDVHSATTVTLKIFSFMTKEKDIKLVNEVPKELSYVFVDENRFQQILSNLIGNAIKHTENGYITVLAKELDDVIEISVKDTGKGIEAHYLHTIFEPFYSLETTDYQGFGLGLSIVKQLIQLQGGDISVQSEIGKGTIFTFTLPAATNRDVQVPAKKVDEIVVKESGYSFTTPYYVRNNGRYTILIVDDQYSNLKVLLDALESPEYNVIAVKNGYGAIEQLEKHRSIDLVILDLMMPGMSGYEVCQWIRKQYNLVELPILLVTAAIQQQDKLAAFQIGANDFLQKPFDLAELKARVQSLLSMKEAVTKALEMESAFLQSQIKPHFLYNVLNTIMALSYKDVEKSRKLTIDFANYLRRSFDFSNTNKYILFEKELSLIRSYVEIEKTRFKERIQIDYEIEAWMMDVRIPPLLIQPLVENAIRHGIGSLLEGGTVKIRAYKDEVFAYYRIEDNGVGMDKKRIEELFIRDSTTKSVGLKNIQQRLKNLYGTELKIESKVGEGTNVTFQIPLSNQMKNID